MYARFRPLFDVPPPRRSPLVGWARRFAPLAIAALCAGFAGVASAQSIGASTHLEFDVTQTDRVANALVSVSDDNPGIDGGASLQTTGVANGTYGDNDITVEAQVSTATDGTPRLSVEGEHVFDLSGVDGANRWYSSESTMLARAEVIDELTISGVAGNEATVELYFQIRGMTEAMIDQSDVGYTDVSFTMNTPYTLETTTSSPHSGGNTHNGSVGWLNQYLTSDLDEQKFVDDFVVATFDVDPSQPVPVEIKFEITPQTELRGVESQNLMTVGLHRPSFWDMGVELLGVVVRDPFGVIVTGATIDSDAGYEYPVEDEPPTPQLPEKVILSPVQVVASDLGEYAANQPYSKMFDQSGLYLPFTSGQTGFDVYFSQQTADLADANYMNNWQSLVDTNLPLEGYLDFDLGAEHTIDRVAIWNISVEDIRVSIADDAAGPWTEIGQFTLTRRINSSSSRVDMLDLGGEYTGRYMRIEVDSAYLYASNFTYAVVGEVAVSTVTPVPEPGLLAGLLLGGALLTGLRARRGDARTADVARC